MGVRKLWGEVHRHDKVIKEIEDLKRRLRALEGDMQGLRISRGRAKAKSAKLEAALAESANKLAEIKSVLN
jgi:septal ring factor EnvC (AmiA/AmiB activator)